MFSKTGWNEKPPIFNVNNTELKKNCFFSKILLNFENFKTTRKFSKYAFKAYLYLVYLLDLGSPESTLLQLTPLWAIDGWFVPFLDNLQNYIKKFLLSFTFSNN